ncbi:uncharacterized protein LOC113216939 [Frankliniella occidentalis]|uniref:Uncharacterized protein LOC113216939 n=1 Tax=Frankliniella occidentalis TaxID=133901 RepID=A0A9C6X9W6_FRAOC|nr:uncharacterized protein LOC113216939 [Frankliniella occidentalis]
MVVDVSVHVKGGGPQDAPRDGALAVISLKALDSPVRSQAPGGCRHGLAVHATTAYNVAVFSCAVYFVNLVLDDVRRDGSVSILNWPILARSFSPSTLAHLLALWLVVNAGVVVANVGFRCWRCGRDSLPSPFVWDSGWVLAALLLHVAVLVVPVVAAYSVELPASATCALCFEQCDPPPATLCTHLYV